MIQRSTDTFLGAPFNIASYSLLTEIIAKMCNMVAGEFIWTTHDTHLYENHFEVVKEQLSREPMELCTLKISDRVSSFKDINELSIDDLTIENYVSHPAIKGELSVGI
jgi:thymidylate synthase